MDENWKLKINTMKEKRLYKLVESLDEGKSDGIGVHESSFIECRFPKESYGYRIYHRDGYCFDITWERQWDEDDNEIESHYEYYEGVFDGFRSLRIEEAIEIIESEGVFVREN